MARVTKCYCDKCHKEIKESEGETVYYAEYSYCDIYFDEVDFPHNVTKELCKECAKSLDRFLNNVPEWV